MNRIERVCSDAGVCQNTLSILYILFQFLVNSKQ